MSDELPAELSDSETETWIEGYNEGYDTGYEAGLVAAKVTTPVAGPFLINSADSLDDWNQAVSTSCHCGGGC